MCVGFIEPVVLVEDWGACVVSESITERTMYKQFSSTSESMSITVFYSEAEVDISRLHKIANIVGIILNFLYFRN